MWLILLVLLLSLSAASIANVLIYKYFGTYIGIELLPEDELLRRKSAAYVSRYYITISFKMYYGIVTVQAFREKAFCQIANIFGIYWIQSPCINRPFTKYCTKKNFIS